MTDWKNQYFKLIIISKTGLSVDSDKSTSRDVAKRGDKCLFEAPLNGELL